MAKVKVTLSELCGETIHVHRDPLFENGRIKIPESAKAQPFRLRVVAVGPDVDRCKAGDFVILHPGAQSIFFEIFNERDILIVEQKSVLAVCSYDESHIDIVGSTPSLVGGGN